MKHVRPDGTLDRALAARWGLLAGVDEVGRGALAGPVVVAAVILDLDQPLPDVDDSKRLSPRRREVLASWIRASALAWCVARREAADIDRINILEATRAAMEDAVQGLDPEPSVVVTDAMRLDRQDVPVLAEIGADRRFATVAAASILAKVTRDALMVELSARWPVYGWARNKGYPSPEHRSALARFGVSPLHRKSFAPVRVLA